MIDFRQIWPETTIFWGAGASSKLGFPATASQGKLLREWGRAQDGLDKVRQDLKDLSCHDSVITNITELLDVLGFGRDQVLSDYSPKQLGIMKHHFPGMADLHQRDMLVWLRTCYDWDALKRIIQVLPEKGGNAQFLVDLFNILDMHITSGLSFNVLAAKRNSVDSPGQVERETLSQVRLVGARNCLVLLIGMMLRGAHLDLVLNHPERLQPYQRFAEILARLMQDEGVRFLEHEGLERNSRAAYLFSYAIVSMNYEPVIMWLLFNAHRNANNDHPPHVGKDVAQPLKLFNDFAHFVGAREIPEKDRQGLRTWYPSNESVVQRLNAPDHNSGRVARVGKFYFPHGCFCWRECPSCGKLVAHWGDEWGSTSPTLFPPTPLQSEHGSRARSTFESRKREEGWADCLQCVYCGAKTESLHTPVVMQTNFKGKHPPFLDEIVRDIRACLENTRHIVLMGYSLPPDDVIYRSLFSSRCSEVAANGEKILCTVVVGFKGGNRWLNGDDLKAHCEQYKNDDDKESYGVPTINAALEIFGENNVRAYLGGIPAVFTYAGDEYTSVRELLYPTDRGLNCFDASGVIRKK